MHVDSKFVPTDVGKLTDIGLLTIDGESDMTVEDVQAGPDDDADDAEEAVAVALGHGPRPSLDVKKAVAEELDCSRKTVQRAAARMRQPG